MQDLNYICQVTKENSGFPERMKNLPDMPRELFVKGCFPKDDIPSVAIVGARMCSSYGQEQAFHFAQVLSDAGVQVISGLAYGIDGHAHEGALKGKTPTFAILGSGVDVCYPKRHIGLYKRILEGGGGIISEYPNGSLPLQYHFPLRNRLISALADLVLIIEAKEKSGSLITARYALEQGKTIFALPGSVADGLSLGCHKLIYDGAGIAYSPGIILEELGIKPDRVCQKKQKCLAPMEKLVYSCLDLRPKSIDSIVKETGLPSNEVSGLLMELILSSLAKEEGRHLYKKL